MPPYSAPTTSLMPNHTDNPPTRSYQPCHHTVHQPHASYKTIPTHPPTRLLPAMTPYHAPTTSLIPNHTNTPTHQALTSHDTISCTNHKPHTKPYQHTHHQALTSHATIPCTNHKPHTKSYQHTHTPGSYQPCHHTMHQPQASYQIIPTHPPTKLLPAMSPFTMHQPQASY